jgi:DeoR/GlpR family transcriptional regulator of sugar metabolism
MLAGQRQSEILSRMEGSGGARVSALAQALCVTQETIRRDMQKLERQRKLIRIHGGAIPIREEQRDLPFDVRKTANLEAKRALAARALQEIGEGDVVALDASSTAYELARALPDMPLTVVTNSVSVSVTLMTCSHIRVVSTGGILEVGSRSYVGSLAEAALQRLNVNKLFLSSKGIDPRRGLSETTDEQARVKRRMMDVSEQVFLLADHSKFGVRSAVFFADTLEANVVITDGQADSAVVAAVRETGPLVVVTG